MKNHQIHEVRIPQSSRILESIKPIDYSDAFAIDVDESICDVDELSKSLFRYTPNWVSLLMRFRDRIVSVAGLKTNIGGTGFRAFEPGSPPLHVGQKIGIFQIFEVEANEIVFGENDKHLDFRVSVICSPREKSKSVILATVVKFNSELGRMYFFFVRPFHKAVVRGILKNYR